MCSHEVCRPRYHCVALENIPAVHFNESCSLQDLLESVAGLRLCNATSKGFFFRLNVNPTVLEGQGRFRAIFLYQVGFFHGKTRMYASNPMSDSFEDTVDHSFPWGNKRSSCHFVGTRLFSSEAFGVFFYDAERFVVACSRWGRFWCAIRPTRATCTRWASRRSAVRPACASTTVTVVSDWTPKRCCRSVCRDSAPSTISSTTTSCSGSTAAKKDRCRPFAPFCIWKRSLFTPFLQFLRILMERLWQLSFSKA